MYLIWIDWCFTFVSINSFLLCTLCLCSTLCFTKRIIIAQYDMYIHIIGSWNRSCNTLFANKACACEKLGHRK